MKPDRRILWLATGAIALVACAHAVPLPDTKPLFERAGESNEIVDTRSPELAPADAAVAIAVPDDPAALPRGIDPADFDISIQYNERVAYFIDYFANRYHDVFGRWLSRMGRFEPHIRERLRENGLPSDLIYLAMIESGFSPDAYSSAKAVGLWQLMEETARMEGLEVSTYIDERRDPIKSTDAAIRHLKGLNSVFDSWYLTAAAYNSGAGRVARTLKQQVGYVKGSDSLFWRIDASLPRETRNYVPQLIAAAIIAKNPDRYGFGDVTRQSLREFDYVDVDRATSLSAIARAANTSVDEIRALNPQLFRGVTPPGRTTRVRVPSAGVPGFAAALERIPDDDRIHNIRYTAASRESLATIAKRFNVTLAGLRRANGFKTATRVPRGGKTLTIPLEGGDAKLAATSPVKETKVAAKTAPAKKKSTTSAAKRKSTEKPRVEVYVVRRGDSLGRIAERHNVTVAQLRSLNSLGRKSVIQPGQRLIVKRLLASGSSKGEAVADD